jgi:hypothetical protein
LLLACLTRVTPGTRRAQKQFLINKEKRIGVASRIAPQQLQLTGLRISFDPDAGSNNPVNLGRISHGPKL